MRMNRKGGARMTTETSRRGSDPDDGRWFSPDALALLYRAQEDIQWLLDRGYKPGPASAFVGSHYQLTQRQRTAVLRASSPAAQYARRKSCLLPPEKAKDGCLYIDGFNLIITLESALSGSIIIRGKDGVLRDLAGLRGTYRLIGMTDRVLELIGKCFREISVPEAVFYLDKPVSNSGRLRQRILEYAGQWRIPVRVELVPNADAVLSPMSRIVTGDSVILDQCISWFNLSDVIVRDYIRDAWIVSFD